MLVPVSVGIAVTRYRLYDIDLVINRALVYGVLGLIVAAAYLVLATALGRLAGGEGSPATATVATVIAALVALAARQAVQQAIDRLLYGRRGDPLAVIGSVARRLESAGTPEGLLTDVVGDLREALKLDAVAVYAVDGVLLAGTARAEEGARLSLAHQGELVGELRVWTARGDELKPGDLRLLRTTSARSSRSRSRPSASSATCSEPGSASSPRSKTSAAASGTTCTTDWDRP